MNSDIEIQSAVVELLKLGPLPSSAAADVTWLEKFQDLLTKIEKPISDNDAKALLSLFGPDDCFGLAWTLLHIIETAPGWPMRDAILKGSGEWLKRLGQRADI